MTASHELTRLTVNLLPKADAALQSAATREGMSRTDVVNRALQLYDFAGQIGDEGGQLLVRNRAGELTLLRLM
jgi:hypothetical protein